MRVVDLAQVLAPGCEVRVTGIRPGEKLHEVLVNEDEAQHTVEMDDMYVVKPLFPWWSDESWDMGKPLPDGYRYTSNNNARWLDENELRDMAELP